MIEPKRSDDHADDRKAVKQGKIWRRLEERPYFRTTPRRAWMASSEAGWTVRSGQFRQGSQPPEHNPQQLQLQQPQAHSQPNHPLQGLVYPPQRASNPEQGGGGWEADGRSTQEGTMSQYQGAAGFRSDTNDVPRSSLDRAGYLQPSGGADVRSSVSAVEATCRSKYASMTLPQLRRQCEDAWLDGSGTERDMIERLVDYEKPAGGWPSGGAPAGGAASSGGEPTRYTIKLAAKIREGFEATSRDLGIAPIGQIITELESRVNDKGITRVRYDRGWLSKKTGDGRVILEQLPPDPARPTQPAQPAGWQPPAPAPQPAQSVQSAQSAQQSGWQPPAPAVHGKSTVALNGEDACRAKYSSMSIDQLRRQCEDAWLSAAGSERDLVDRLVDYEKPAGGWPAAASSMQQQQQQQQQPAISRTADSGGYQSSGTGRGFEPEPQIVDRYGDNRAVNTTPQMADRYGADRPRDFNDYGQQPQQQGQLEQGQQPGYGHDEDRRRQEAEEQNRRREEERRREDEQRRKRQDEERNWQQQQQQQPQRAFSSQQPVNDMGSNRSAQPLDYQPPQQQQQQQQQPQHAPYANQRDSHPPPGGWPNLERELESVSRELAEAARQEAAGRFTRLEDQLHQLSKQRKAELLAIRDRRLLQLAGECVRSAVLYVLRDAANIRQSQKIVLDEGETSHLKEACMMLLAVLAENRHLESEFNHPVGPTQRNALDAAVLIVRGWAGPEGMRRDRAKAAASPWRAGSQPKAHDNLIRQAVTMLCFASYNASERRRQEMSHKKYPDLISALVEIGREQNPRHGSILAFATVAFFTGTRVEPAGVPSAAASQRAGPDGPMIDSLCQAFDQCMRGDDGKDAIESYDSATPKAEHSHLIAEAVYEMCRTAGNVKLLLRQDIATRLLLEACVRYRGSHAPQVVHAAARALLCLSLDVRGAQVLEKQGHAMDTLRRVSESREIDEETRLYADRAGFALNIRREAEQRAGHQPYLTASLSGAPGGGSILVSYTKNDEKRAAALVNGLRRHNLSAQIVDASTLARMTGAGLAASIDGCAALLLCCSRSYRESSRCQLEVAYARARRTALRDIGPAIVPIIVSSGFKSSAAGWLTELVMGNSGRTGGTAGGMSAAPAAFNLSEVDVVAEAEQAARGQAVLRSIGTSEMEQLRQFRRADAPPALRLVLDAVATLLGRKPEQPRDPSRGLFAEEGLLQQLQNLVPSSAAVAAARKYTTDPLCTPEAVGKTSVGGRLLCEWVRAVTSEFSGLLQTLKQLATQHATPSQRMDQQQQQQQLPPPQQQQQTKPLSVQVPNPAGSTGSMGSSMGQIQPMPEPQPQPQPQLQTQPAPQPQQALSSAVPPQRPPSSGSVPPPVQHQRMPPTPQAAMSAQVIAAAAAAPARPPPNAALTAMSGSAIEAWLRRIGLAELYPKLQSKRLDNGAALGWISIQLRDSRAEVLSKYEDLLRAELQVPLGVLFQFLYHVEHFNAS